MKTISSLLFLALPLLATALRAQSGPAAAESSASAATAAKVTAPQPPPTPSAAPSAVPSPTAMIFGPVVERSLLGVGFNRATKNSTPTGTFLDLKSGNIVNQAPPGDIGAAIYENTLDVEHGLDLATVAVTSKSWLATPAEVLSKLAGAATIKETRLNISPGGWMDQAAILDGTGRPTYFFRTREGAAGILQFFQTSEGRAIDFRIRYKLLLPAAPSPSVPKP
jgi:hypothetical protein